MTSFVPISYGVLLFIKSQKTVVAFSQIQRVDNSRIDEVAIAERRTRERARGVVHLQDQAMPGPLRLRRGSLVRPQVERGDHLTSVKSYKAATIVNHNSRVFS